MLRHCWLGHRQRILPVSVPNSSFSQVQEENPWGDRVTQTPLILDGHVCEAGHSQSLRKAQHRRVD